MVYRQVRLADDLNAAFQGWRIRRVEFDLELGTAIPAGHTDESIGCRGQNPCLSANDASTNGVWHFWTVRSKAMPGARSLRRAFHSAGTLPDLERATRIAHVTVAAVSPAGVDRDRGAPMGHA